MLVSDGLSIAGAVYRTAMEVFSFPKPFSGCRATRDCIAAPYILLVLLHLTAAALTISLELSVETDAIHAEFGGFAPSRLFVGTVILVAKSMLMINPLVVSFIALLLLRLNISTKPHYRDILSVVLKGEVLFAVGVLLTAPLILITQDVHSSLSLGPVVRQLGYPTSGALYFLATTLSVFFVLEIVVVARGLRSILSIGAKDALAVSILSVGGVSIIILGIKVL